MASTTTDLPSYGPWMSASKNQSHTAKWYAAECVYPGSRFKAYAILGDDVVIGDSRVAEKYSVLSCSHY